MRDLCAIHFPEAGKIRVALDILSTHTPAALYRSLPAAEARRSLRRIEFHFTPEHARWRNMVEIGTGVLQGRCLKRRIADKDRLEAGISAWEKRRNDRKEQMNRMFTIDKAREKPVKADPKLEDCTPQSKEPRSL